MVNGSGGGDDDDDDNNNKWTLDWNATVISGF
jgi:hypothetical protein